MSASLADLVTELAVEYLPGDSPADTDEELEALGLALAAITRVALYVTAATTDELRELTSDHADDDMTLDALGWGQRAMAAWITAATAPEELTINQAAEDGNITRSMVAWAKVVAEHAPDLVDLVIAGGRPLKAAYDERSISQR